MSWSRGVDDSEYKNVEDPDRANEVAANGSASTTSPSASNHAANNRANGGVSYSASGYSFGSFPPPNSQNHPESPPIDPTNDHPEIHKIYKPFFIPVVVVLPCVIVFIITMFKNNCPSHETAKHPCVMKFLNRFSFEDLSTNPLFGPSSNTLLEMGALQADKVRHHGQGWRLLTCMWLHAGVIHLLANIVGLFFVGIPLEKEFGALKVAVVYLLSGLGGSALSALFLTYQIGVGASGALFGLVGATISELLVNWGIYSNRMAALFSLLAFVIINLVLGLMPFVDNFAHIGGFLAGFFLGFVVLIKPQFPWIQQQFDPEANAEGVVKYPKYNKFQIAMFCISILVLAVCYALVMFWLFSGSNINEECGWCHNLNCIETRLWSCSTSSTPTRRVICEQTQYPNGTGYLTCTNNKQYFFSNLTSYSSSQLQTLCANTCG